MAEWEVRASPIGKPSLLALVCLTGRRKNAALVPLSGVEHHSVGWWARASFLVCACERRATSCALSASMLSCAVQTAHCDAYGAAEAAIEPNQS